MDNKLQEFYTEFNDEVKQYTKDHYGLTTITCFKEVFLSYLSEADEAQLADCTIVDFKKEADNIRLDGYAYSEYFHSLTLLVSMYDQKPEPQKIWKRDIDKQLKKATKFYKSCNENYFDQFEESGPGYQAYQSIMQVWKEIESVNIILITNDQAINYIPEDSKIGKVSIKYDVWDIERLYQTIYEGKTESKEIIIRLKNKYKTPLLMIKTDAENSIYDCYVGIIPGKLLAQIYKDEGQNLIQKNVRSFLQATGKVNKGIKYSLAHEPEMFMAYNNGVSTIADSIVASENSSGVVIINEILGWQIVNGGQTTASIYNAFQLKQPLDSVFVQVKLSVIKDNARATEIAANISKYANSQNKITMSDFNANDQYHIEMENLSRGMFIPVEKGKSSEQWFYERARGQYMVELNNQSTASAKLEFKRRIPKSRCISKTVAAKVIMAWMGHPDVVSKGLETNFVVFSEMINTKEIPSPTKESYIDMISKVILFNACDKIIADQKFGGYKAQIDYYVMALLGKYCSNLYDSATIWEKQGISAEMAIKIEELAYKVWNHFQNPVVKGVNISQWCKKEDCWKLLQNRFENNEL